MSFRLSDDKAELQLDVIHGVLTETYWSPGISRALVQRAIDGSWCIGAYDEGGAQVGFARLITDRASFAWLADVFVVEAARGQGVSKAMVAFFVDHPELKTLRRWMLGTWDAHGLYRQFGFEVPKGQEAERLMQKRDQKAYLGA